MLLPYKITIDTDGVAAFTADNKSSYKALFLGPSFVGEPQLEGFIFDFSFERDTSNCENPERPGHDPKIKLTLEKLINRFFEDASFNILSFVCESRDCKDMMRLRMFNNWHKANEDRFMIIPFAVAGLPDEFGETTEMVGGVVFFKSHPLRELIEVSIKSELIVYSTVKTE